MGRHRRSLAWLALQLGLGLGWIAVLASRADRSAGLGPTPPQVEQMLIWAAWLPSVALAAWQVNHRRWRDLILSDMLAAGLLVLLAFTAYVPLFFIHVVWFLPMALLPRGVLAELLMRLIGTQ